MTSPPKISVIVPVYNAERFLNKCLSSLISQSFKEFEAIIVEGGSTDGSLKIIKEYTGKYLNMRLFTSEKPGVGAKRNIGVQNACGKYIAFLDSDDFYSPDYLLKLYTAAEENNADICCCNYSLYSPVHDRDYIIKFRKPRAGLMSSYKAVAMTLRDFFMRSYLWNKMFRRSLFTENGVTFPDIRFEDVATTARLMYFAKRIFVINDCLYHYTWRKGSVLHTICDKNIDGFIYALGMLRVFFEEHGFKKRYKYSFFYLGVTVYFTNWWTVLHLHVKKRTVKGLFYNIHRSNSLILGYIFGSEKKLCKNIDTEKKIVIIRD